MDILGAMNVSYSALRAQTIRLNVSNDFTGLIYVIGNADLAGNAEYEGAIIVDGVAIEKTDGSQETYPVHPSNVRITSLDTSDPERTKKLEGE